MEILVKTWFYPRFGESTWQYAKPKIKSRSTNAGRAF